MAYDTTSVAVSKSQLAIRELIYGHRGTGICFVSQRPAEGFEAMVTIESTSYRIRVMATCKEVDSRKRKFSDKDREQEERRVWRVLYWHLKAMFEAADSGVIDIRDVIMPYIVLKDDRTLSEHLVPRMSSLVAMDTARLLTSGPEVRPLDVPLF